MSNYDLTKIINLNNLVTNIIYYEKITSTNDIAKEMLKKVNSQMNNFLVLSNCQTNGRGKGDAYYFSPAEVGIYMSLVLIKPTYDLRLISIVTSLAISNTLSTFVDASVKIKWPNDILINNKKVCGILIESATQPQNLTLDYVIVGIGINISNEKFCPNLESIATSLKKECGQVIDRNIVIIKILNSLNFLLTKSPKKLFNEYLIKLDKKSLHRISQFGIF